MTRAKRIVPAVLVSLTLMVLVMPASAWAQAKSELTVALSSFSAARLRRS